MGSSARWWTSSLRSTLQRTPRALRCSRGALCRYEVLRRACLVGIATGNRSSSPAPPQIWASRIVLITGIRWADVALLAEP